MKNRDYAYDTGIILQWREEKVLTPALILSAKSRVVERIKGPQARRDDAGKFLERSVKARAFRRRPETHGIAFLLLVFRRGFCAKFAERND